MISQILSRKTTFNSFFLDDKIVDLLSMSFQIPSNYSCQLMEVDRMYVGRPDLLCDDLYGDEDYADILMKLNGISNPYELNEGMLLLVPAVEELDRFVVNPSSKWKQTDSEIEESFNEFTSPASEAVTKKESSKKRKPNEAVLNNPRFVIDPLSKIIVY